MFRVNDNNISLKGNFTLDMSVLAGLLSNSDATLFTAYITANGAYTLSITNAGTLKDVQGEGAKISWTTADNEDAEVTAQDLRMIIAAVAVRSNALHTAYRVAKAQVEAAVTADEVRAVCMEL